MSMKYLDGKNVLLTGATGSFGKAFVRYVLEKNVPERLVLVSRDELKQFEMAQIFSPEKFKCLEYRLGDIRDKERLYRLMDGIDVVVHAAALKQVPTAEVNPTEYIRTNILGTMNVIDCAMERGVNRVIALSTDKACNPVNLYGATKLCADKLVTGASFLKGTRSTKFSVVRYGNVIGSRGSVIPFFLAAKKRGEIPVTDPNMTRFFITLTQAVEFVLNKLETMMGGEIFVPKIPSMSLMALAKALAPDVPVKIIGIRPGEKLHELMISSDDARNTYERNDCYVIFPQLAQNRDVKEKPVAENFSYSSDKNDTWLTDKGLFELIEGEPKEPWPL